jgi:hypothetical protein
MQFKLSLEQLKKIIVDVEKDIQHQSGEDYIIIDTDYMIYIQPCVYKECVGRVGNITQPSNGGN